MNTIKAVPPLNKGGLGGVFVAFVLLVASPVLALTSNDPLLPEQWFLNTVRAPAAWDVTTGSNDVVVALLDTGMDMDHPDLAGNLWMNPGEIPNDGRDNEGNGYVDDVHGWNFADDTNHPSARAGDEATVEAVIHGTLVAGVIGAIGNNAQGVAGLNWNVRLMPVRILDSLGSGSSPSATEAVHYAINNGADIINMSFTGFDYDPAFEQAVKEAYERGVVFVAALGNQSGGGTDVDVRPVYPACFSGSDSADWVIGVTATDRKDAKASFSNYGKTCADIAAPGVEVFGTLFQELGWTHFEELYGGGWNGTSIAAPMVAGAVALLKAKHPELTPRDVQTILQLSVDPLREPDLAMRSKLGAGRLNIANALAISDQFAKTPPEPHTPLEPPVPLSSIVVAPAANEKPMIRVFSPQGTLLHEFFAYEESFTGGVRIAQADIDSDGTAEIVTVPGPGRAPLVRIFSQDGKMKSEFVTGSHTRGKFVAAGDVNGDGTIQIVLSDDARADGRVEVWSSAGERLSSFMPYANTTVSVRVAVGNTDATGASEIILVPGAGSAPLGKIVTATGASIAEFFAYAPTYDRGSFVSAGDLDGDGDDEIVTGVDIGGGPHVRIFGGDGRLLGTFFAYDELFRGGVRVAVGRFGQTDSIVAAAGPGGGPHIRVFNGQGRVIGGFFTDAQQNRSGIYVGAFAP